MKSVIQKSIEAGINLRGTRHAGQSAAQLRRDNPQLAQRWAKFITENKAQLVSEISTVLARAEKGVQS